MVNAQEYIDKNYPKENRSEITELDISRSEIKNSDDSEEIIKGELDLSEFTNLKVFKCSSQQISCLNLSNCSSLKELDCSSNLLNDLNASNCHKLEKINCSNNQLTKLDLGDCFALAEIDITNNKNLNEIDVVNCIYLNSSLNKSEIKPDATYKLIDGSLVKKNNSRNVLMIGTTGSGKSALGNVLAEIINSKRKHLLLV